MEKGEEQFQNISTIYSVDKCSHSLDYTENVSKEKLHLEGIVYEESAECAQDPTEIQEYITSKTTTQTMQMLKGRREREPLLICKVITKWPVRSFVFLFLCHLMTIIISIILLVAGYDLVPVDFETLPLEINDQPWRPRELAWMHRNEFPNYYDRSHNVGYRLWSYQKANIDLYYDGKGKNVFTKENLQRIESIEKSLTSVEQYETHYCQLDSSCTKCQKPISVIRYFDGTYADVSAVFNDPNFDDISTVLYEAYTNNVTKADFQFFLGKEADTRGSMFSPITRTVIPIGYPIEGITDMDDYEKTVKDFQKIHMKPTLQSARYNNEVFDFSYRSEMLWVDEVFEQANEDVLCAAGSICFIFIFVLVHTKSLWITGFAVFSIMSCFVISNLIYRVVLDFRYIGYFHVLTIFIVLGIGADDIFVFYDVWRNTAYEEYPSLAHRLSDAYRKSVFSMLFTSITTAVAFLASSVSPLLATRSFGIFSGLVILVNYISVILFFPTVVVFYHIKFEKFKWPRISVYNIVCWNSNISCKTGSSTGLKNSKQKSKIGELFQRIAPKVVFRSEKNNKVNDCSMKTTGESLPPPVYDIGFDARLNFVQHTKTEQTENNPENNKTELGISFSETSLNSDINSDNNHFDIPPAMKQKEKTLMVRFFRDKYSAFVTQKIIRWIIMAVMAGVVVFFTLQAAKLEPDNEWLKILNENHVYSIAQKRSIDSFISGDADRNLKIYIVWGMNPNDMADCHFSKPHCEGQRVWDTDFNPSTQSAQDAVQRLCKKMFQWTEAEARDYRVKRDFATGELQINCFITNLDSFLVKESSFTSTNWNLPYNYSNTVRFMEARPIFYNITSFNSSYKHHLQIPMTYWLSNRFTFNYTDDYYLFNELIGEEVGDFSTPLKTDHTRKYGNNFKYIAIQINTTLNIQNLGYAEGIPIMNRWEDFVNSEMKNMPAGMNHGFETTVFVWHWLIVTKMLATNAISGIILGVCLALPILIIATKNIVSGVLATFSICCSTICVVGVITLGGWKLGVLESLNMCMVVGLTVDYVVHLAEGYTLSLHKDRFSRVCDMLDEMAVSIFFGACTTLGASMFMFIAQLSFFRQFGIFMFATIGFSLFFSMGMFVTLMGICGPEGNTGNLEMTCERARRWCSRQRKIGPSESRTNFADELPDKVDNIMS